MNSRRPESSLPNLQAQRSDDQPIRILHVVDTLAVGGLQSGLVKLIENLDPQQFEHVVCAMRATDPHNSVSLPPEKNVHTVCLSREEADARIQVPALVRRIREAKPDVVHSRNWGACEAMFAARWVGSCARVHSEHGLDVGGEEEPRRRTYLRRLAYQAADRVLSVSCQLRDHHAQRTGYPAAKIEVIHNGVDTRRFSRDAAIRARIRTQLGLTSEDYCIGCVGSLLPVKDQMTLLRALAIVAETRQDWRLLLIGEGPDRGALEAFVNRHSWKHRVSFRGISNRVEDLLKAMDVCVLPSITEGISNSLLEAMATGLPVIATEVGGNPEVVRDRETGLLFPVRDFSKLAEQLLSLCRDPEMRATLGDAAVRSVRQKFSLDSMVCKYEQMYQSLAGRALAPMRAFAGV